MDWTQIVEFGDNVRVRFEDDRTTEVRHVHAPDESDLFEPEYAYQPTTTEIVAIGLTAEDVGMDFNMGFESNSKARP